MKFLVVLSVALACAAAASVQGPEASAPVVRSDFDITPEGFQYAYETANGIAAQATGAVENFNSPNPSLGVKGSYRYTSPDGTPVVVEYFADATGFHPTGSHLPVGPEIPPAILKSLAYIAAHPPAPVVSAKLQSYQG